MQQRATGIQSQQLRLALARDDDNVRLPHGTHKPENREDKLVRFYIRRISGGFPWVVLFAYFTGDIIASDNSVPNFVYVIFIIYLILFMSFAVNQVLQYKGVGKWKDYLFGEREYIILSFVAKTFLVWLVFVGLFKPF